MEEDFGRGPWLTMKSTLGLDERDPTCFLCTYSIIMVLRKVRVLDAETQRKGHFYISPQPSLLHLRQGALCLLPPTLGLSLSSSMKIPLGCIFHSPTFSLPSTVSGTGEVGYGHVSIHLSPEWGRVSTLLPLELPLGQKSCQTHVSAYANVLLPVVCVVEIYINIYT